MDSGCSHHRVNIGPSDASVTLARTIGELVGWCNDNPNPGKNVCVLKTSSWFLGSDKTPPLEDDKDLFSIWVPSILELKEYQQVSSKKKSK